MTIETVGDVLDAIDGVEPGERANSPLLPFFPATLPDAPKLPAPGIYFGMPEEDYFALPALSASGIKDLLASPMLFWARSTWLSEVARKQKAREASNPKAQMARLIGRAYHCRLLEGTEEYARRFACELTPEDCEGALTTTDQIKAAISAFGVKPWSKVPDELPGGQAYERSAKKEDWIRQLLAQDPDARILDVLEQQHEAAHAGKSFISAEAWEQIEYAAKMIEADEGIRPALTGGYPEVTLIWHDKETGVPMKARVDRLKLKAAIDLKSIALNGRSIEQAIRGAIARYTYVIQPSHYVAGIQAVKALVREGNGTPLGPIVSYGYPSDHGERLEWAKKWAADEAEPKWAWLFQGKGDAPVTRLCFYPMGGSTRMVVDEMCRQAARKFRKYSEAFGVLPWIDQAPPYDLADEDFFPSTCDI
jgi:hypothetical protein